jgi:hypothetical protein
MTRPQGSWALALLATAVCYGAAWPGDVAAKDPQRFLQRALQKADLDLAGLGLTNCTACLKLTEDLVLAACRHPAKDTDQDNGLRLYLLARTTDRPAILFESKGFLDSYYLRPDVFEGPGAGKPILLLVEHGAEFSYGVEVYQLQGKQVQALGAIEETVKGADNPASVVPHTIVEEDGPNLVIRFNQDVLILDKAGHYQTLAKDKIRYLIKEGKLQRVLKK